MVRSMKIALPAPPSLENACLSPCDLFQSGLLSDRPGGMTFISRRHIRRGRQQSMPSGTPTSSQNWYEEWKNKSLGECVHNFFNPLQCGRPFYEITFRVSRFHLS